MAIMMGVPVLGELPTQVQWIGIAMVVGGVICAVRVPDLPVKVKNLEAA